MARKRTDSEVEAMVSGGRWVADLVVRLISGVEKRGGNLSVIHRLTTKEGEPDLNKMLDIAVGELVVSQSPRSWREQNGVICFSVTSDGTTGGGWIKRLEDNGFRVGEYAKRALCSPDFKPTSGITTEIAVLRGMLFEDNDRTTEKIRAKADQRKFTKPNAEVACLIREKFTDKEIEAMGLWYIVAMHEPIEVDGGPSLLSADRGGGGRWLGAYRGRSGSGWARDDGFAFAVS